MKQAIDLVQWAPKVPRRRIRELYEADSAGMADLEMIDQVGWALYSRCEAILQVTAAHEQGAIVCPACGARFQRDLHGAEVICSCGWQVPWEAYHQTYRGRQLYGANAVEAFAHYAQTFPRLSTPQTKMVAIDQLLHQFHVQLKNAEWVIGRPTAGNLIEGNLREVCAFLDDLSSQNPELAGSQAAWRETFQRADWSENFRPAPGDDESA